MDYLIAKYDSIKDSSPTLLKSSLEAGEMAVYWVKDKAGELVEKPMELAMTSMEERKEQLRSRWESSNAQLQARMNEVTAEVKKRSDSFQLQCVEGVNNVLDYVEYSMENYTLPPEDTEESLKNASGEATATVTMRRMWDLTYRINAGALQYAAKSIRTSSEPLVLQLHKHLHPGQVRVRVAIIRVESFGNSSDFESNEDLTAVDRRIIQSARPVLVKASSAYHTTANIVGYPKRLFVQITSTTMKDVQVNGLRTTNMIVGGIVERFDYLKKSQAFNHFLTWTERKEKILIGAQE